MKRTPALERGSSGIFISYRREDAPAQVGRLDADLRRRYGEHQVFLDRKSIEPGEAFPTRIETALRSSAVVLVVMGRRWLGAPDRDGRRRVDAPDDWVRKEVSIALATPGLRVTPVLVAGAGMPRRDDLPEDLQGLSDRNAVVLRDADWDTDLETLCAEIDTVLRRLEAGLAGALSLALAAAPVAALLLAVARWLAPFSMPGGVPAAAAALMFTALAAGAGYRGIAGSWFWLARLSWAARRPTPAMAAVVSVVLLAFAYSEVRPVQLSIRSASTDACLYKVQPYQETGDRHRQGGDRLLDAAVAPCKTEFSSEFEQVEVRTGPFGSRQAATAEVRVSPGTIRAVLYPKGAGYAIELGDGDVPAAPASVRLTIPDLADLAGFAYWITLQSPEDRVRVTITLSTAGGTIASDATWVSLP